MRYECEVKLNYINFVCSTEFPFVFMNQDENYTQVWQVPIEAEVIASSEKTGIEMFSIGDHILGIQGHPEYNKDILHSLIDRLLADESICVSFGIFLFSLSQFVLMIYFLFGRIALLMMRRQAWRKLNLIRNSWRNCAKASSRVNNIDLK